MTCRSCDNDATTAALTADGARPLCDVHAALSAATRCTVDHEALKQSPRWSDLVLLGVQHTPADEDGPEWNHEVRNCSCGTTLYRLMEAAR